MKPIRFTQAEVDSASEEWGFNCGPGAICAALGMTPAELRPHLLDFEAKGYTNPTLMAGVWRGLGVQFERTYRSDLPAHPALGVWKGFMDGNVRLVRIQWAGKWTEDGVPMRVRYRQTHWIAVWHEEGKLWVFDINAVNEQAKCNGWLWCGIWERQLVPWLLKQCVPGASGEWWPTHVYRIDGTGRFG